MTYQSYFNNPDELKRSIMVTKIVSYLLKIEYLWMCLLYNDARQFTEYLSGLDEDPALPEDIAHNLRYVQRRSERMYTILSEDATTYRDLAFARYLRTNPSMDITALGRETRSYLNSKERAYFELAGKSDRWSEKAMKINTQVTDLRNRFN